MIKIKGSKAEAIVYTDIVDDGAIDQIKRLCMQDSMEGSKIRVMPDVHVGVGCTIGFTMTIKDKIVPNLVGVDIGCGMETIEIANRHIELQKLDKVIRENIPFGKAIRKTPHRFTREIELEKLKSIQKGKINLHRAYHSLGSLGGGNHFIEAAKDEEGTIFLTIHSGSRHPGRQVAEYYQDSAFKTLNRNSQEDIQERIDKLKKEGRERDIEAEIRAMKEKNGENIPYDLAYLEGEGMEEYLYDMKIMQEFARLNRLAMMDELIRGMKLKVKDQFTTIHNYIDMEHGILRKGAVSAQAGEKLIIPINMKDGSLICIGKGNEEWNFSAPHGAGRLSSRKVTKETFTLTEFKKAMEGIYTTTVGQNTLDECPMAYKPIESIVENIGDTVEIVKHIRTIYNFKAEE